MRLYKTLNKLWAGEPVVINGFTATLKPGAIEPGDTYVAERNTGPWLLTAKDIHPQGWISSEEGAYPYDTSECVRVDLSLPG